MATKSANVMARVEPDIKEQAEAILNSLGITSSAGINMFYRQVIYCNGLPFRPSLPVNKPKALDEMTKAELYEKLERGINQAKNGEGIDADVFFDSLRKEILDLHV